jgi:membrane-associated protease RseP (regulator of RpoE activity)
MKTKSITIFAVVALLPLAGFAQTMPVPPAPPAPPTQPVPPERREKAPKVPVTFLGVNTSPVPTVVYEQLGLPKGFGLVVDYVVPDGPAAAAGVQPNDILKLLNDQILMSPSQLAKLVRSYPEGTTITLTILRKGQEQKVSVKLTKKEVSKHHSMRGHNGDWNFDFGNDFGNVDIGDLKERLQDLKMDLKEQIGDQRDVIQDAVIRANDEVRRARDEARRARGQINVVSKNGLKTTRIDISKAQIVFSDDKGEMKLETVDGKRLLTAKDPQGKLQFSGPVETKEELDKLPPDVRQRFDKLQEKDLPTVASPDDEEEDAADENDDGPSMQQVSSNWYPRSFWTGYPMLI